MSLWTEVFVIHLLPRGLVRLVGRVFTFRAFGGYCLASANQNYFHICAVRFDAGSSSIYKATPRSIYFFDIFRNYVGTQNGFKTKLKVDFELRFHDFEWSWAQLSYIFGSFFHDLEWFWVPILEYLALWRVSGPPLGHPGVPWGARVPPTRVQGEKSWFVGPPLASQNEVILASFFA